MEEEKSFEMDARKIRIFYCCEDDLKVKGANERDGKFERKELSSAGKNILLFLKKNLIKALDEGLFVTQSIRLLAIWM